MLHCSTDNGFEVGVRFLSGSGLQKPGPYRQLRSRGQGEWELSLRCTGATCAPCLSRPAGSRVSGGGWPPPWVRDGRW